MTSIKLRLSFYASDLASVSTEVSLSMLSSQFVTIWTFGVSQSNTRLPRIRSRKSRNEVDFTGACRASSLLREVLTSMKARGTGVVHL